MPVDLQPLTEVKQALAAIDAYTGEPEDFVLTISDSLQDAIGLNMAIITDRVLARGWEPNRFEQREGYRLYRYKTLR